MKPKLNKKPVPGCSKDFICSYCPQWVPGIECSVEQSYKDCIKLLKWKYCPPKLGGHLGATMCRSKAHLKLLHHEETKLKMVKLKITEERF
jgi:hypothetical protein